MRNLILAKKKKIQVLEIFRHLLKKVFLKVSIQFFNPKHLTKEKSERKKVHEI